VRISVKVHVKSSKPRVEVIDAITLTGEEKIYHVYVNALPEKGRANVAVIEMLSEFLDIPKSRIMLVTGHTSSNKLFEIED
jgi:uncharacterized protein YggU (UPF0235/DUF167 family)